MRLLLSHGNGAISALIKWQQRSDYSHAALWDCYRSNMVYEAREFKGVRRVSFDEAVGYNKVDVFEYSLSPAQLDLMLDFLDKQVGKKYDYTMVLRFISRRQESRSTTGKWFCSELVMAAFAKVNVELLARIPPCNVSPGLLSYSPLWKYINTVKRIK